MAIQDINLSAYVGKLSRARVSHTEWNGAFGTIQTKVNEIITAVNTQADGTGADLAFTVNGVPTQPTSGIVQLASKGRYVLSGTLNGRVVIGTAGDTWLADESSPTQVILDGCTIVTDSAENAALEYAPSSDKLLVTVANNTVNHLVCTHVAAQADSQKGALHAENDLIVQGGGYLSCINKGGHGIKASELRLSGNPHIYVEVVHDGIHGNKMICIDGGEYYINGANDAFGTRAESGTPGTTTYKSPGKIWIFGGEFYAYGIKQQVFDSKADGYIFCTEQVINASTSAPNAEATNIVVHTDVDAANVYSGVTPVDPQTYFGAPVVTGATLADGVYTANATSVTIKGYFKDVRFVFPVKSTEVTLNAAYISVSDGNALDYTVDSKNIKVTVTKDTANIIKAPVAINSANNISVEAKNFGILYIEGDVTGSEVSVRDSFGAILVDGEVTGSQILMAEAGKTFGGSLKANVITARLSGKNAKGNIIVSGDDMIGCVTTTALVSRGTATMADTYHVTYSSAIGSTFVGDKGPTREPYIVQPYGKNPI